MKPLSPTLWRTCRALSGHMRLRLLQHVFHCPGMNVSGLAAALRIGISDASQELRRLQSRGLLRRSCQGVSVVYLPIPDPQVPSATPLLYALKTELAAQHPDLDRIAKVAKGLGHDKRGDVVRFLRHQGPQTTRQLAAAIRTSLVNLSKHLKVLADGGWIAKKSKRYELLPTSSPLMSALLDLL